MKKIFFLIIISSNSFSQNVKTKSDSEVLEIINKTEIDKLPLSMFSKNDQNNLKSNSKEKPLNILNENLQKYFFDKNNLIKFKGSDISLEKRVILNDSINIFLTYIQGKELFSYKFFLSVFNIKKMQVISCKLFFENDHDAMNYVGTFYNQDSIEFKKITMLFDKFGLKAVSNQKEDKYFEGEYFKENYILDRKYNFVLKSKSKVTKGIFISDEKSRIWGLVKEKP